MALVNQVKREINAKIVFFGPELAGKATNLKHVFGKLKPEFRGTMKTMNVQDARMLFFDFTPPQGELHGFRVRIHVYTISGAVADAAAWKMVLKGVDGVVFVADTEPQRREANRRSLDDLAAYLKGYGQSLASVPMVFQFNKSDLPYAVEVGEMQRLLNPAGLPSFKASSQSGDGVLQTLLSLVKTVLTELRDKGLEGVASGDGLQRIVEPAAMASAPVPEDLPEDAGSPASFPMQDWPTGQSPALQARESEMAEAEAEKYEALEYEALQAEALEAEALQAEAPADSLKSQLAETSGENGLSLELSGAPQAAGPGLFRLPLTIRAGSRSKSVVLNLAISLEEG